MRPKIAGDWAAVPSHAVCCGGSQSQNWDIWELLLQDAELLVVRTKIVTPYNQTRSSWYYWETGQTPFELALFPTGGFHSVLVLCSNCTSLCGGYQPTYHVMLQDLRSMKQGIEMRGKHVRSGLLGHLDRPAHIDCSSVPHQWLYVGAFQPAESTVWERKFLQRNWIAIGISRKKWGHTTS